MARGDIVKMQNLNQDVFLCIIKRGETIRIRVNDILYVESRERKLHIHTASAVYEYNDKISHVRELLETEGFIRCHQSFLVRQAAVTVIRRDRLVVGEREIQISRKYKEEVMRLLAPNESSDTGEKAFLSEPEDDNFGNLLCISGPYAGKLVKLVPEQEILIGRDGDICDIVFNLPRISRQHLRLIFHNYKRCYEVMDLSTNGTYMNGEIRLERNVRYEIEMGQTLYLGDGITVLKLV
ncbi:MAG: LytTR family transcriptional regulator DNA-binding domain-containing protein [Lachnospiraceae bacterium]|nr:LytTR family transcriptional regulator DNA-binding domain-containing protein [Lachnospiraceae bacterium]